LLSLALRLAALTLLISLTLLALSAGLPWAVNEASWYAYPSDRLECPNGAERWGRVEANRLRYACFALADQKGSLGDTPQRTP
jgi:hypothetical protein